MADEERNKALVRQHFDEFVNRKDSSAMLRNTTLDFYDHDGPGGQPADAPGDKAMMEAFYDRWPDLRVTIEDMVAEGDKVVVKNRWEGTNRRTGAREEMHGFVEWRIEGGKLAERWATVTQPAEVGLGVRR